MITRGGGNTIACERGAGEAAAVARAPTDNTGRRENYAYAHAYAVAFVCICRPAPGRIPAYADKSHYVYEILGGVQISIKAPPLGIFRVKIP